MTLAPAAPGRATAPGRAVLAAELRLFLREPGSIFWVVGFPTALLVIFSLVPSFREERPDLGGLRILDLYVPVLVLLGMIVAGLQTMPPVVTGYRERGILRRMSTTPVRPAAVLGAQMGTHGAAALASAAVVLVLARVAFDVRLPSHPLGYLLAIVLTAVASLALGALVSAVSATTKVANAVGSVIFFPSLFCAGVWLPVQSMPDALGTVVGWTPFGAAALALGEAAAGDWPSWSHLGVLLAWAAVLTAAAARWFRWE